MAVEISLLSGVVFKRVRRQYRDSSFHLHLSSEVKVRPYMVAVE